MMSSLKAKENTLRVGNEQRRRSRNPSESLSAVTVHLIGTTNDYEDLAKLESDLDLDLATAGGGEGGAERTQ